MNRQMNVQEMIVLFANGFRLATNCNVHQSNMYMYLYTGVCIYTYIHLYTDID